MCSGIFPKKSYILKKYSSGEYKSLGEVWQVLPRASAKSKNPYQ